MTTISLSPDKGSLRLRWAHSGQRYVLYLGLPDNKTNRRIARELIVQIEADIEDDCFDSSLARYRRLYKVANRGDRLILEAFDAWVDYKAVFLDGRTINQSYKSLRNNIAAFFAGRACRSVTRSDTSQFILWLKQQVQPGTVKRRVESLSACWQWGQEEGFFIENPWENLSKSIKTHSTPPSCFTRDEVAKIIEAFKTHSYYKRFAPFVQFLFATGCRTGEGIGLRWKDLSPDFLTCTISQQLTRGKRKTTKTGRSRTLHLPTSIQIMLQEINASRDEPKHRAGPDDLVFQVNGKFIDDANFRHRAWKSILEQEKIPYKKPYSTRHTFISHCLEIGMNPVEIAQITGHDVAVLFKHYAAAVKRTSIPDLF